MALEDKFVVRLTAAQRQGLTQLAATGKRSAAALTRARILLEADADGDGWTDGRIAQALDTSAMTVARGRKEFVQRGPEAAVTRQRPTGRQYRKLDGAQEARLLALACSPPPQGRQRRTMQLLADELVELQVVDAISDDTVQRALKKWGQAAPEGAVGPAAQGQRRLRRRQGGRPGGLLPTLRPALPGGGCGRGR